MHLPGGASTTATDVQRGPRAGKAQKAAHGADVMGKARNEARARLELLESSKVAGGGLEHAPKREGRLHPSGSLEHVLIGLSLLLANVALRKASGGWHEEGMQQ